GDSDDEKPAGPFRNPQLLDLHRKIGAGAVEDTPAPDVEVVAGGTMDRLGSSPDAIGHSKDNHAAFSIREASGVLHRQLHIFLRALPGLEVEPLRLQLISGCGIQAVEEGQDLLAGGYAHGSLKNRREGNQVTSLTIFSVCPTRISSERSLGRRASRMATRILVSSE